LLNTNFQTLSISLQLIKELKLKNNNSSRSH